MDLCGGAEDVKVNKNEYHKIHLRFCACVRYNTIKRACQIYYEVIVGVLLIFFKNKKEIKRYDFV